MPDFAPMSDTELINLYKRGSENAFSALLKRYSVFIKAKASEFYAAGIDCDDIFQEATIAFVKAAETYDSTRDVRFSAYVSKCVTNKIISFVKSQGAIKHKPHSTAAAIDDTISVSGGQTPEEIFISRESAKEIGDKTKALLSELESKVLYYYLGAESYESIAVKLDVPVKTVDNALGRIRTKLKNSLRS